MIGEFGCHSLRPAVAIMSPSGKLVNITNGNIEANIGKVSRVVGIKVQKAERIVREHDKLRFDTPKLLICYDRSGLEPRGKLTQDGYS